MKGRQVIRDILDRKDHRIFIVVGPCSIHDVDAAKEYAEIRANLSAKGLPIGNNDLWIAAHSRALGHTLVTNNVREFERVENLKLDNWVLE